MGDSVLKSTDRESLRSKFNSHTVGDVDPYPEGILATLSLFTQSFPNKTYKSITANQKEM